MGYLIISTNVRCYQAHHRWQFFFQEGSAQVHCACNTAQLSEKCYFRVFPILPGSAEAQVIWGGIVKHLLIAYFISNISAKKCQNPFMRVKVLASRRWDVFWDTGYNRVKYAEYTWCSNSPKKGLNVINWELQPVRKSEIRSQCTLWTSMSPTWLTRPKGMLSFFLCLKSPFRAPNTSINSTCNIHIFSTNFAAILLEWTSGYATWFTAGGAIRIAHYDVIDDVIIRTL